MDYDRFNSPSFIGSAPNITRTSSPLSRVWDEDSEGASHGDSDSDIQVVERHEVGYDAFPHSGARIPRPSPSVVSVHVEHVRRQVSGSGSVGHISVRSTPEGDVGSDVGSDYASTESFVRRLFSPERSLAQFQPFAPSGVTSSRFFREVLSLRVSMVAPLRSAGYDHPDLVIPERDLRALLMRALVWMIERECIVDVDNSRVVFVGREAGEAGQFLHPSIILNELHAIAGQLPEEMQTPSAMEDFDAFMFHAKHYFTGDWFPIAIALGNGVIFTVLTSILFFCFVRVMELIL